MDVRRICDSDLEILREWFKDEALATYLGGMLPLEQWYRVTEMDGRYVWMTHVDRTPVGMIDVQIVEDEAHIAVAVNPRYRRNGYGKASIDSILKQRELSKIRKAIAGIPRKNVASIRCFESCGFTYQGVEEDGCFIYSKTVHPLEAVVRSATPDDCKVVSCLISELNKWAPDSDEMKKRMEINANTHVVLLAEIEGEPVGYLTVRLLPAFSDEVDWAEILELYVRPPYRHIGIGRTLMNRAVSICRSKGFKELQILVSDHISIAVDFYTSYGFEKHSIHMNMEI